MASVTYQAYLADTLTQLRDEKRRCEAAILALRAKLERLAPTQDHALAPRVRSRRGWTAAKRQEVSRRMRAFWAARRQGGDGKDSAPDA